LFVQIVQYIESRNCELKIFAVLASLVTAAVSDERRRWAHLFLVEVPAHYSAPSSAALAEGSRAAQRIAFKQSVLVYNYSV